jgi:hypothetical protein
MSSSLDILEAHLFSGPPFSTLRCRILYPSFAPTFPVPLPHQFSQLWLQPRDNAFSAISAVLQTNTFLAIGCESYFQELRAILGRRA